MKAQELTENEIKIIETNRELSVINAKVKQLRDEYNSFINSYIEKMNPLSTRQSELVNLFNSLKDTE